MYIEVEGKTYYINIRDHETGISYLGQKEDAIHIAISARLSQDELVVFLKNNGVDELIKKKPRAANSISTIQLFDSSFTVILQQGLSSPHIVGKSIYTSKTPKAANVHQELIETLLIQEIKQHIGFWEETLSILIKDVCIRRLKRNYYTVSKDSLRLTFEKSIVLRSRNFIAFICAIAVFDYLKLEDSIMEELGMKYVKDWKHQQRILIHELGPK